MNELSITTLGRLSIERDGEPVAGLASRKAEALLVYLACNPRSHPREVLADLLWDDRSQSQALANLRVVLSSLRKELGDSVTITRDTARIRPGADLSLDVAALEAALSADDWDAKRAAQAIDLYRDEFLSGFYLREATRFEEWQVRERERLHRLVLDGLQKLVDHSLSCGSYETGTGHANRLLALEPLSETAHRQLMQLLALSGQRERALAQYDTCRRLLWDELGVEPAPETVALLAAIRSGTLKPPSPPPPPGPPHHLPAQATTFIGRRQELAEVRQLLASSRLVTLTGAGGCGKTRLALRVASDLQETYPDGVRWVDLAPLADPTPLPQAIAKALNIGEASGRALLDLILDLLQRKHLLLVLDNCEHLVHVCAQFVHGALGKAPHISILATSREPLAVIGEMLYPVPPLALPPKAQGTDIATYDSIRLFVERAQGVLPGFELTSANTLPVVDICRRLDGIPLAIELASARVNVLTVEQVAARLDDRFALLTSARHGAPSHHRTLRAALDWSYSTLSSQEQTLLRRLSVFAGGFTLDAAEQVCASDGLAPEQILDGLSSLVNKSLVVADTLRQGKARYWMLETIRQYARDKLIESGEREAIRTRHLDYFLKFAEKVEPKLHGPDQNEWLDRLDRDHDNLRAALEWSLGEGQVEKGLRLAAALMWFWEMRSYWTEARQRVKTLLNQPEAALRTLVRAKALLVVATMGCWGGDNRQERPYAEELIAIAREHGEAGKRVLALGLARLGHMAFLDDDIPGAISIVDEGLEVAVSLQDDWLIAFLLMHRGAYSTHAKDHHAALKALEESRARFKLSGDNYWTNHVLFRIGFFYRHQGDLARARQEFERLLPLAREMKDRRRLPILLTSLGGIELTSGRYDLAKRYFAESLEIDREFGDKENIAAGTYNLGIPLLLENDLDSARLLFAETLALGREIRDWYVEFECIEWVLFYCACLAAEKNARRAIQLFAVTDSLFQEGDVDQEDEVLHKRYLGLAREQVDEEAFDAAWAEGCAMSLEQAIAEAERETLFLPAVPD